MKVAMYWHNGRSLGHTVEAAKVAQALVDENAATTVAGITGAFKGLELLPTGMDVFKLPSFVNYDRETGWNAHSRIGMGYNELFALRRDLVELYLSRHDPDVLLVNHLPYGAEAELKPELENRADRRNVLMLRGILFDRDKTRREYFTDEITQWIDEHFNAIVVHTDPAIFKLQHFYEVPDQLQDRIVHVGYLGDEYRLTKSEARQALGVLEGQRFVAASMGGGQGAWPIWEALVEALKSNRSEFDQALLVTGPYLEADAVERLLTATRNLDGVEVVSYHGDITALMKASDLFIGAAGANMLGEMIGTGCNAIAIPRQVREPEQILHSGILAERGLMRRSVLPDVLAGSLAELIHTALSSPIDASAHKILLGGARRYPALLRELVAS